MINCEELKRLIEKSEKENTKIELKSLRKLYEAKDGYKDIACGIVALANRYGGRFILGINDDGSFDGKLPLKTDTYEITIEDLKEKIFHLIRDHTSPIIETDTEYLECVEGDAVVINVPKRKGMPHAYIEKREGSQIKTRTYYIRTPHGKTLVSDHQLEWLFKNQNNPDFEQDFRISLEFNQNLELASTGFIIPHGNYLLPHLINLLDKEKRDNLFKQNDFSVFIAQLLPFAIMSSLSQYFIHGWHVGWRAKFDRRSSGVKITDRILPADTISLDEIPIIGETVFNSFSGELKKYIKQYDIKPFKVPKETKISISFKDGHRRAVITFKHPAFQFEIYIGMLSCGTGLNQTNPYKAIVAKRKPELSQAIESKLRYFDGGGEFVAKFEFPDNDFELFDIYLHYSNSIKTHLCYEWDIQEPLSKWPDYRILEINDKLDDILNLFNSPKEI